MPLDSITASVATAIGSAIAIALGALLIWLSFSTILEHALRWLLYGFFFLMLESMFRLVGTSFDFLVSTQALAWFMLNITLFKLLNEQGVIFVVNAFLFFLSLEYLILVIGTHHTFVPHAQNTHEPGKKS